MTIKAETVGENKYPVSFQDKGRDHPGLGAVAAANPWAGLIYHDLRHPLTAILAYSELLAEYDLDKSERIDFHQEIRSAVSRMNDLISLLLEASKDPVTCRPEVVDIVSTVQRAIQVAAVRPDFRRIAIGYLHEGLPRGWFDPGRLQQVITNVVLNACEAVSPACGRIDVRSVGRQDFLEISISDNGPGIPDAVRHAVFQPFVTYGKEGGTGLGLAIVQKILRDQGGEIYLEATSEEGTRFRVVLPYVSSHSG